MPPISFNSGATTASGYDTPQLALDLTTAEGRSVADLTLFYYEIYAHEFDAPTRHWRPLALALEPIDIEVPEQRKLVGFDVNCASQDNVPECSPLSCNGLASTLPVNSHCLFSTFDAARHALEDGRFDNAEPGPYRIYAVYEVVT